jgi:hypothetical protein
VSIGVWGGRFADSQGFCVAEIWDSQDQHDAWFNENVAPNVSTEIKQEVIQIHNLVSA